MSDTARVRKWKTNKGTAFICDGYATCHTTILKGDKYLETTIKTGKTHVKLYHCEACGKKFFTDENIVSCDECHNGINEGKDIFLDESNGKKYCSHKCYALSHGCVKLDKKSEAYSAIFKRGK